MTEYNEILIAARQLPSPERMKLIDTLWETVPPEEWPLPSEAWIAEAQRRSAEFDAGRLTGSSWPEVRERARKQAGLDG